MHTHIKPLECDIESWDIYIGVGRAAHVVPLRYSIAGSNKSFFKIGGFFSFVYCAPYPPGWPADGRYKLVNYETGALVAAVTMSRNTTPEEQERLGIPLFEFSSAQMETRGAQTAIIDYLKSGWDAQDGAFISDFDSTAGKKVQTEVIRLMKDNAAMAGVEEEECRFACYNCSSHNHKVQ